MADYQRILSYLYRYDKKEKKDCKGFIKAEQRDGSVKLTIQIEDERLLEDMTLKLCFYRKVGENWKVQILDRLSADHSHKETVLSYPESVLPGGFDLKHQYGALLYYQDSLYYGSVWIGEEIPFEDLPADQTADGAPSGLPAGQTADGAPSGLPVGQMADGAPSGLPAGQTADGAPSGFPASQTMGNVPAEPAAGARLPEAAEGPEISEMSDGTVESGEPEIPELPGEAEAVSNPPQTPLAGDSGTPEKPGESHESQEPGESRGLAEPGERKEIEQSTESAEKDALEFPEEERGPDLQPMENIFNPAFHKGYRIRADQLKLFGDEAERLSQNQFLLKGYHRYDHLLVGEVRYGGRNRSCVGVPGIYENREKYMANLYQFPVFLTLAENRIKTGGFGYWLHLLDEG